MSCNDNECIDKNNVKNNDKDLSYYKDKDKNQDSFINQFPI